MKIKDPLEHSLKFVSNSGNRFKEDFHGVVQEDGSIELVSDGFTDTQKMIEADAVGSDVKSLIAKALAGDMSVFRADAPFYADVAEMPKTYAQILNIINEAHREFDAIPLEIREKFHNNFDEWFATLGTEDWMNKCGIVPKAEPEPVIDIKPDSEVKE